MDFAEWVTIVVVAALFLLPVAAVVVVRYRQKKGLWSGGVPGFQDPINPVREFNDPPPPAPDQSEVRRHGEP